MTTELQHMPYDATIANLQIKNAQLRAEVERLKIDASKDLERLRSAQQQAQRCSDWYDALNAEMDTIRGSCEESALNGIIAQKNAEIAELRKRLKEWAREEVRQAQREASADAEFEQKRADSVTGQLATKDREIERLRSALNLYADVENWDYQYRDDGRQGPLVIWTSADGDRWYGPGVARAALATEPGGEGSR